jgi:hypothetical protein
MVVNNGNCGVLLNGSGETEPISTYDWKDGEYGIYYKEQRRG